MVKSLELAHQLHTVLKVKSGEEVALFCAEPYQSAGWDFVFRISKIGKESVEGLVIEKIKNDREPKFLLTLYQSILKKDNFEWILEKGAEIGVAKFVPMISSRSVKTHLNHTRARKAVKEAAEQTGRAIVPALTREVDFDAASQAPKAGRTLGIRARERDGAEARQSSAFEPDVASFHRTRRRVFGGGSSQSPRSRRLCRVPLAPHAPGRDRRDRSLIFFAPSVWVLKEEFSVLYYCYSERSEESLIFHDREEIFSM